jgi:glutamate racemase
MEGKWTVVKSNRYKNTRRPIMKHPSLFVKDLNRYEVLQNIEERTTASQIIGLTNNRGMTAKKRKNLQKKKPKIVVLGDSHTTGIAGELRHNLGSAFEVIGYVKPGSAR